MANLSDIVNILETTGNAMQGLGSFTYGARSEVNINRSEEFPKLVLDRNLSLQSKNQTKGTRVYAFIFQFYSLFHRDLEARDIDQQEQDTLERLSEMYFAEVVDRLRAINCRISNDTYNGEFTFMAANDRLLKLELRVNIEAHGKVCTEGVFTYGT